MQNSKHKNAIIKNIKLITNSIQISTGYKFAMYKLSNVIFKINKTIQYT